MLRLQLLLLVLLPLGLYAGADHPPDSLILLEETVIRATRYNVFTAGHGVRQIEDRFLQQQSDQSIDLLLARYAGISIKNYGPGILATSSLRGGSAAQTSLIWNGFQIQSPMHGQTDLALIPAFFIDQLGIQYGGSSALWGSGSMGGAIHLNNHREKLAGLHAKTRFSFTDLEEAAQQLTLSWGNHSVFSRFRFFNRNSANRYNYKNTAVYGSPIYTQEHAALDQWGLLHETYIQIKQRHQLDIRWWWQETNRNIPPPMMQNHREAYQEDGAFRITGQWQTNFDHSVLIWRGGFFEEALLYSDNLHGESRSWSNTLTQEAEVLFSPGGSLLANAGVNTRMVNAWADDYKGEKHNQNSIAFFSSLKWDVIANHLQFLISGRQEFVPGQQIPFVPSVGLLYRAMPGILIKANAGKNYRLPTLNDKYWMPGGNPDLQPEQGWSQDLTILYNKENIAKISEGKDAPARLNEISVTGYHRTTTQWIIWLPQEGSIYWSPKNLQEVRSYGFEANLKGSFNLNRFRMTLHARWDHTVAQNMVATSIFDASAGKQLIYVPKNTLGYNLHFMYVNFLMFFDHQYTGRRYTSSDNRRWIDPYHMSNIGLQWQGNMWGYGFKITAVINNLWNEAYEGMAGRPMPLRHLRAGFSLDIPANADHK